MDKKLRIASVVAPIMTLATVATITFAVTGKQASEASGLRDTATLTPSHISATKHLSESETKDGNEEKDSEEKDGEENDDAPLTAKLTPGEAQRAALTSQPGIVTQTELEDEDGTTVYGVDVKAVNGNNYDVKVDANTGQVLKSDVDQKDKGSDGDGEENDNK